MQNPRDRQPSLRNRGATLIELVVVLASLAALVPLLAAAGGGAARPNRERMCAYRLGRLGSAMLLYTIENDGFLVGSPGTSGAQMIYEYSGYPGDAENIPIALTQTWDWAAPLTPYLGVTLDTNRAKRFEELREGHFWCPSNNHQSSPFFIGQIGYHGSFEVIRMGSYLTMRNMLLYEDSDDYDPALGSAPWWNGSVSIASPRLPDHYRPRMSQLGTVMDKVFLADGSRFMDYNGLIDHDIAHSTISGGAYSDGGPTLPESYLRSYFLDSPLREYSYRHAHGVESGLNAVHYDGHVSWMSDTTSRHPRWWWPTGTTIPWAEMNQRTRAPLIDEILQDPNLEYHVP